MSSFPVKRVLLCGLFVVLSGCDSDCANNRAHGDFTIETPEILYEITCTFVNGVPTAIEVPYDAYNPDVQVGPAKTESFPGFSTCSEIAELLEARFNYPSRDLRVRGAQTTAGSAQPVFYGLDQTNLAIQVINPSPFSITEVDLPGGGNTQYPTDMAITPDGSTIWVIQLAIGTGNLNGILAAPPLVSIFNVAQQAFTGSFALPSGISPNSIQFSLDGTTAYITNDASQGEGESGVPANSSVLVVNVATQTVTKTIPTPKGAGSAALSPDGLLLYTIDSNAGYSSGYLTVIDTTTNTLATSAPLAVGEAAYRVFVNPTGTRLYIFRQLAIDIYDTATLQQVASIPAQVSSLLNYASFTADGSVAWLAASGAIYQVDVRTSQVIDTIPQNSNLSVIFTTP